MSGNDVAFVYRAVQSLVLCTVIGRVHTHGRIQLIWTAEGSLLILSYFATRDLNNQVPRARPEPTRITEFKQNSDILACSRVERAKGDDYPGPLEELRLSIGSLLINSRIIFDRVLATLHMRFIVMMDTAFI